MTLIERIREKAAAGQPVLGAVWGAEEAAGADFVVVRNSARFPGLLVGMLPLGDANAIVLDLGREAIAAAKGAPVLAGLCAADPMRHPDRLLDEVQAAGFAGVQNFPTVGLIDGAFRRSLEDTEFGFAREIDLIRAAARADLFTAPLVFTPEEAVGMLEAGADVLVAHAGLGPREGAARRIEASAEAARAARKDAIVLAAGSGAGLPRNVQGLMRP